MIHSLLCCSIHQSGCRGADKLKTRFHAVTLLQQPLYCLLRACLFLHCLKNSVSRPYKCREIITRSMDWIMSCRLLAGQCRYAQVACCSTHVYSLTLQVKLVGIPTLTSLCSLALLCCMYCCCVCMQFDIAMCCLQICNKFCTGWPTMRPTRDLK